MVSNNRTGFIFDMDGVLVDNAHYHTRAWLKLFKQLGIEVDEASFHLENAGQTNAAILRWKLGEDIAEDRIKKYAQEKEALYRVLYSPHLQPLPGLRAFLDQSLSLGIQLALATSAEEQNIALVLDGLDLRRYFPVIVGAGDIQRSKPDPEIFLVAAKRLGVPPQNCFVFEDSLAGVQAAWRAGMRLVLITTSIHEIRPAESRRPEITAADFTQLSPEALISSPPVHMA